MQNEHKYLKVKDRPGLVRDPDSKAILSVDRQKLVEHREKVKFFKSVMEKTQEVDNLKQEVSDIKNKLDQILEALNNKQQGK